MRARLRRIARWALDESPTAAVPFRHLGQAARLVVPHRRSAGSEEISREWADRLQGVDVLSVDMFDTLVQRRLLRPDDVHEVVGFEAGRDRRLAGLPWTDMRRQAEGVARKGSPTPDVTLDGIFEQLGAFADAELLASLKRAELRTELELVRPTARGRALWQAAREAGARIVVTTDIYLPKAELAAMLTACGYEGWDSIRASGADGVAKFDGSSFRSLREDYPGLRILHVGDNRHSDVRAARRSGVTAELLERPLDALPAARGGLPSNADPRKGRFRRSASRRTAWGASASAALTEDWLDRNRGRADVVDEIGYGVLGPALAGFSQYLGREAERSGIDRLIFLAREGAILRRAYEASHGRSALENDYAVISTRVLGLSGLVDPTSEESLHFLTKTSAPLTPADFVSRILPDVPEADVRAACRRAGVAWGRRLTRKEARRGLAPVFAEFAGELAAIGRAERPVLIDYLASLKTSDPGTAIVDVGWAGSIQSALNRLTGRTHTGFYLALSDSPTTRAVPRLHGWIDQRLGGRTARDFRRVYARTPALEVLLANTDHGSAAAVRRAPDGFAFEYLPNEFQGTDAERIVRLQARALEYVRDYAENAESLPAEMRELSFEAAFGPVFEFLTSPSLSQLRALRGTQFDGSYGVRAARLGRWWIPTSLRRR